MNQGRPVSPGDAGVLAGLLYRREAGFLVRSFAAAIDVAILGLLVVPTYVLIQGMRLLDTGGLHFSHWDALLIVGLPAAVVLLTWMAWGATPGKRLLGLRICDARTGESPSGIQFGTRLFAYVISASPLGLGFAWVLFHPQRRGWHDLLADTVVIYRWQGGPITASSDTR